MIKVSFIYRRTKKSISFETKFYLHDPLHPGRFPQAQRSQTRKEWRIYLGILPVQEQKYQRRARSVEGLIKQMEDGGQHHFAYPLRRH